MRMIISFCTCAISGVKELYDKEEWPTWSYEESQDHDKKRDPISAFIHKYNSYWVTSVRYNANFFAKVFALYFFVSAAIYILLGWL